MVSAMILGSGTMQAQSTSAPDTASPSQQVPQTSPTPSPEVPPATQQAPNSQAPDSSSASKDASQTSTSHTNSNDTTSPEGAGAPSSAGAAAATDNNVFTGVVEKQGDKYVLKDDAGHTYDVDQQEALKKFEGKRVRIQGTLDAGSNKIMVR